MHSFGEYLEEICFEENPTILDDDMPDFFADWMVDQDIYDLLVYSEGWGRHIKLHILREVTNLTK